MPDAPRISVSGSPADVLGQDHEDRPSAGRVRLLSLGVAAVLGFGVAQVVPPVHGRLAPEGGPALALVTGRQPFLDAVGEPPVPSLEVVLVNTAPATVRLLGARVADTELRWEADRPLEPGQQATAVVREEGACGRGPDLLSAPGPTPQLVVQMQDRPEQRLALDPVVARQYDDHVRNVCGIPRLPEALQLPQGANTTSSDAVTVAFGVLSRSVRPLRVVGITAAAGLDLTLTDAAGRPVSLPLSVPGQTRQELAVSYDTADPATTPYRVRLTSTAAQCSVLREMLESGEPLVRLAYEGQEQAEGVAETPLFVDLVQYVQRLCGRR